MARPYLILLFSLVFFVAGGLLFWRGMEQQEKQLETEAYLEDLSESIDAHWQEAQFAAGVAINNTSGIWRSHVYRHINPIILQTESLLRSGISRSCGGQNVDITVCAKENVTGLAQGLKEMLLHHHKEIDLSEHQAEEEIAVVQSVVDNLMQKLEKSSATMPAVREKRAELYYVLALNALAVRLIQLTASRGLWVEQCFPIVQANQSSYAHNESGSCHISIGYYSSGFDRANTEIIVDGKSIALGEDGRLPFNLPTNKRGSNDLDIECRVTNPLTGRTITGKSTFTYHVR